MLRLRTTASLSLLALLIGAVGTHWLSGLGTDWQGLPSRVAATRSTPANAARHLSPPTHPRAAVTVVMARQVTSTSVHTDLPPSPVPPVVTPDLVPVSMPADTDQRWHEARGHLDGLVVLQLDVDAAGQVRAASVAQSSGDPQLDAHALHSVQRWRFAVPAGHPDGLRGTLPMRFSSHAVDLVGAP